MTHLEKEISKLEDRVSVLNFASRDLPSKREKIMEEIASINHKIKVMKQIERDEAKQKRKGKRRRVKYKYVIVSGRSSHTVSAENIKIARTKFKTLFPYANIKMISEVR